MKISCLKHLDEEIGFGVSILLLLLLLPEFVCCELLSQPLCVSQYGCQSFSQHSPHASGFPCPHVAFCFWLKLLSGEKRQLCSPAWMLLWCSWCFVRERLDLTGKTSTSNKQIRWMQQYHDLMRERGKHMYDYGKWCIFTHIQLFCGLFLVCKLKI